MAVTASMTGAPNHHNSNGHGLPRSSGLSMYDPLFLGIDEFGAQVTLDLVYRNILAGGEPGGGKSGLLNVVAAHAALSIRCTTRALRRETSRTRHVAPLRRRVRRPRPRPRHRRPQTPATGDGQPLHLAPGQPTTQNRPHRRAHGHRRHHRRNRPLLRHAWAPKQQQDEFAALLRDLVARGRACGIPVVAATQRPSYDIIPTSLRDLFGYRAAFRCTTTNSSNIVLGQGWAEQGYSAADIPPTTKAPASCSPRVASRDRSRSPTCPTATSSPSPTTPRTLRGK